MVPTEEVQVLVDERRESPGIGVRNGVSIGLQLAQYRIPVARVPEHDRIDDEAQRAALIFLPLFVAPPSLAALAEEHSPGDTVAPFPSIDLLQNATAVRFVVDVGQKVKCLGDSPNFRDGASQRRGPSTPL